MVSRHEWFFIEAFFEINHYYFLMFLLLSIEKSTLYECCRYTVTYFFSRKVAVKMLLKRLLYIFRAFLYGVWYLLHCSEKFTGPCIFSKILHQFYTCGSLQFSFCFRSDLFIYLGFLSQTSTNHRTAGEGGDFNPSLTLSLSSQTLRSWDFEFSFGLIMG